MENLPSEGLVHEAAGSQAAAVAPLPIAPDVPAPPGLRMAPPSAPPAMTVGPFRAPTD